jgi:hypothetical protein
MNHDHSWLDALTDGQMLREWSSLHAHFFFSLFYLFVLSMLLGLGLSLLVVLVGAPILLLALSSIRTLATFDHQLIASLLQREPKALREDIDMRGANFGERLGMLLGSGVTWRSLLYLTLKFFIGIGTIAAAWMLLPFMALEVLVLAPLTLSRRQLSVQLLHWLAVFAHEAPSLALAGERTQQPVRDKAKRDLRISRLETIEEEDDDRYILTDDGEVTMRKRR